MQVSAATNNAADDNQIDSNLVRAEPTMVEANLGKKRHVVSRKSNKTNRTFAGQYIISFDVRVCMRI